MAPQDVPNFVDIGDDDFLQVTRDWLAERGWALFARDYYAKEWPLDRLVEWLRDAGPGAAFIISGSSGGFDHAVIALDGKVFDPSDCGISGPHPCKIEGCDCSGYWWSYLITRRHTIPA